MNTQIAIINRYSKENGSSGCGNLWPFLNLKSGMHILDLGSGNGTQASLFADKIGNTGKVIGLDITPERVAKANSNFQKNNLQFVEGNILNLPFSDNYFDLVTSNCVINHVANKDIVFKEIYRILKNKGGEFLISDICALDEISYEEAHDPEKIAECWAGAVPRKQYLADIANAGFINIEILARRKYQKAGHWLESLIIKGVKL